jgi:cell division cycle 20, cofactor of APC complex
VIPIPTWDYISSLSWSKCGTVLVIAYFSGDIWFWDVISDKPIRRIIYNPTPGYFTNTEEWPKICSLSWKDQNIITSGNKTGIINNYDVRYKSTQPIKVFKGLHNAAICGLKWSKNGSKLASGGNDDLFNIWEFDSEVPIFKTSVHKSAVKAICWSPIDTNVIATGGGTHDHSIRIFDISKSKITKQVDLNTGGISSLLWTSNGKYLLASQTTDDPNIYLLESQSLKNVLSLRSHEKRILGMVFNSDQSKLASAGADERLVIWNTPFYNGTMDRLMNSSSKKECIYQSEIR